MEREIRLEIEELEERIAPLTLVKTIGGYTVSAELTTTNGTPTYTVSYE